MKTNWPRSGQAPRLALLLVVGFSALGLLLSLPALALPTLYGGQVYYAGGDLTIDVLHNDTVYGEVLQLWSGVNAFDVADGSRVGSSVTLTQEQLAAMGISVGDELRFGIRVLDTSHSFVLGPASRNIDGIDHAYVRFGREAAYVGFEDLFGGGDRDYNDTVFRFSGVSATSQRASGAPGTGAATTVPEPDIALLLLSGIGVLGWAYRKR